MIRATKLARFLFGLVGAVLIFGLVRGLLSGEFNMHGEPLLRAENLAAFISYAAFLTLVGLGSLCVAIFGRDKTASD